MAVATGQGVGPETAAKDFRSWASMYRRRGAAFTSAMMERCAEDGQILSLASQAQPGQPASLMFLGAVNSIVLSEVDDPLAPYLTGGSGRSEADDATFAALKDFCRRKQGQISEIVRSRTVQVTSPRRAGFVPPLFGHIMGKGATGPFSLVEVGCSAGLLTVFDKYCYDYGALGRLGDPADLQIPGPVYEGAPPLPQAMPKIAERFGIDLEPIDPSDPEQVFWLQALSPYEAEEGRRELRRALEWRARIPLQTIAEDALKVLPGLIPKLKHTAVILHANCLYQWPPELQKAFDEMLLEQSRARPIYRLGLDFLYEIPGRPPFETFDVGANKGTDMIAVTYRDGRADWDYLGICDGIGLKAQWMA